MVKKDTLSFAARLTNVTLRIQRRPGGSWVGQALIALSTGNSTADASCWLRRNSQLFRFIIQSLDCVFRPEPLSCEGPETQSGVKYVDTTCCMFHHSSEISHVFKEKVTESKKKKANFKLQLSV